jgi:hypothetical protein
VPHVQEAPEQHERAQAVHLRQQHLRRRGRMRRSAGRGRARGVGLWLFGGGV